MKKKISVSDSIEEKKWYKNTTAILAIVSTIIIITSGIIAIINSDLFRPKKVPQNIEIVIDRSADLNDDFGGKTKIEAIKDAMKKVLDLNVRGYENVALRQFGGICYDDKNTRLLVDFGQNNGMKILNELDQISISGQATLVSAIVSAMSDFSQERFKDVKKKIIVITTSSDSCYPDAAQIIKNKLKNYNIDQMDFWFIGMGVSQNQHMELINISIATGGETYFVNSNKELENVLTNAIEQTNRKILTTDPALKKNPEIDARIVSLALDKYRYNAGDPITATLTIVNTGKFDITSEKIIINTTVKSLDDFVSNLALVTRSEKEKTGTTSKSFIEKISPQSVKSVNATFTTEQEMYGLKLAGDYSVTVSLYVNDQLADAREIQIKLY